MLKLMPPAAFCPNCYHPDPGDYCPQCGQNQSERRATIRSLVSEFLDDQFGVNNRLPRTFKALLFKPGVLTNEYFNGRIQQYIPPLRLYLLASLSFFALFLFAEGSTMTIRRDIEETQDRLGSDTAFQRELRERKHKGAFVGIRIPYETTDNWVRDAEVNFIFPPLTRSVQHNLQKLSGLGEQEATQRITRTVVAQMPKVFFVFLPIYAFLLYLFFHRQRKFYVEHFVFSLHLHAFAFMALIPLPILGMPGLPAFFDQAGDILSGPLIVAVFVYIYIALKRVYGQGWRITALKYSVLWILYMALFGAGVLAGAVLALATV
jgi:hypothetical protein